MNDFRAVVFDAVAAEISAMFPPDVVEIERGTEGDALKLCASWRDTGRGCYAMLPLGDVMSSAVIPETVEYFRHKLWETAPIAGSA